MAEMTDEYDVIPPLGEDEEYVVGKGQNPMERKVHRRRIGEQDAVCRARGPRDKVPVYLVVDEQVAGYTDACARCWQENAHWATGPHPKKAT